MALLPAGCTGGGGAENAKTVTSIPIATTVSSPVATTVPSYYISPSGHDSNPRTLATVPSYYISPSGNDSNPGTLAAPFSTIQHAANVINPGDTVIVENGTYTVSAGKSYIVSLARGGTAGAPVTFKAQNRGGAILDGQRNRTPYCIAFSSASASYVNIQGFTIQHCAAMGIIANVSGMNHVTFSHNIIQNIGQLATCSAYGEAGIYFGNGTSYMTADANLIHDVGRLPTSGCSPVWAMYVADHGIYSYGHNQQITNNVFYNITSGWSIQIAGGTGTGDGPHWLVANNTFGPENNPGASLGYVVGDIVIFTESGGASPTNITIDNNASYGGNASYLIDAVYYPAASGGGFTVKNNLSWGASLIDWGSNTAYVTSSGNLLNSNPLFTNYSSNTYTLDSGSPAISAGVYLSGVPLDFDGATRPNPPSIGAYEYGT